MSETTTSVTLQGVAPGTLQAWLLAAQNALASLMTGQLVATVSYQNGSGNRSVTYTKANVADLRAWIMELQAALGNTRPRAIGVMFR